MSAALAAAVDRRTPSSSTISLTCGRETRRSSQNQTHSLVFHSPWRSLPLSVSLPLPLSLSLSFSLSLIVSHSVGGLTSSLIPAVSRSLVGTPEKTVEASTMSLVVPAISVTMALSAPLMAFSKEDLPTLGAPIRATVKPVSKYWPFFAVRRASRASDCRGESQRAESRRRDGRGREGAREGGEGRLP